ncbi:hypothetical protein [Natrarchaeobaculum aegyptiacum]|uniref:Envelope protein N-terminal domain-containing protein n=1 Tax=Natrarchaeobaculum aegyptiacum TaxID=745377 RepID=A0A2Z2HXE9_9EURY|nr:hypothetical protein [Natrarchaeobaculum aegyptiacum]ARS89644.1 hypothetical protein B1756_07770 [Natrarchaeobaculum aegyptiacum]
MSDDTISRRSYLRRVGTVTGGAAATTAGATQVHPDASPVGNAEAAVPVALLAVGVAGGAVSLAWTQSDWNPFTAEEPPEGMTAEAAYTYCIDTARARLSNNKSTIIDNKNIIQNLDHRLYGDGKLVAIEKINEQVSQDEVEEAAIEEAREQATTIIKNYLKSWNEGVREWGSMIEMLEEHPDAEITDVFPNASYDHNNSNDGWVFEDGEEEDHDYELPNGETFYVNTPAIENSDHMGGGPWFHQGSPIDPYNTDRVTNDEHWVAVTHPDDDERHRFNYLNPYDWLPVLETLEDIVEEVEEGLETWVDGVYGDVQSGDLDPADLIGPRELAEMSAEEEGVDRAIADLISLNAAVNLDREAELYFPDLGISVVGMIALSGEQTLEAGDVIDPNEADQTFYFNYDVSSGTGDWDEWDAYDQIEAGVMYFTEEPLEGMEYHISTISGEVAVVTLDDFTPVDEDDEHLDPDDDDFDEDDIERWEVDLSDQLDDRITEVDDISAEAIQDDTEYEMLVLNREFEIVTFRDEDGEEYEETTYEETIEQPHDDDNYITEEEWEAAADRHLDLIERYEESQQDDGFQWPTIDFDSDLNPLAFALGAGALLLAALASQGNGGGGGGINVHNHDYGNHDDDRNRNH